MARSRCSLPCCGRLESTRFMSWSTLQADERREREICSTELIMWSMWSDHWSACCDHYDLITDQCAVIIMIWPLISVLWSVWSDYWSVCCDQCDLTTDQHAVISVTWSLIDMLWVTDWLTCRLADHQWSHTRLWWFALSYHQPHNQSNTPTNWAALEMDQKGEIQL